MEKKKNILTMGRGSKARRDGGVRRRDKKKKSMEK
jgi:hypothetical protein